MSPCGFEPAGKYQSAGAVYPLSYCSVETSTVTVLPGGSTGGPATTANTALYALKTAVPAASISDLRSERAVPGASAGAVAASAGAAGSDAVTAVGFTTSAGCAVAPEPASMPVGSLNSSRRTHPRTVHIAGESTGAGLRPGAANGFRTKSTTVET